MQPLERLILETWRRIKPQLLANPAELARRLKRREAIGFSRPRRAWCLAVRACDRRIGVTNGAIDPEYAIDPHDPDHPGRVMAHSVTLSTELLRQLCRPVVLDPWGELHDDAAKKLGTTSAGLTSARISGALQTHHIKGLLGRRGPAVPLVYSPKMLDPSAGRDFEMAHPLWIGTECVSARVRNDLAQTVMRVPVYRSTASKYQYAEHVHPEMTGPPPRRQRKRLPPAKPDYVWYKWSKSGEFLGEDPRYWRKHPSDPGHPPPPQPQKPKRKHHPKPSRAGGSITFYGWRWLCPKCNRQVRTLYLPAPPECILKDEVRSACPEQVEGMEDENGIDTPSPVSSFACGVCHRLRYFSSIMTDSWNDLVSHLSGGLLRGKDIPKPAWFTETVRRKKRYVPQINRAAPRRQQVLNLVLSGYSVKHIAAEMDLHPNDVYCQIRTICRRENVPDRIALMRKYGSTTTMEPNCSQLTRLRREQVLELLLLGQTNKQIAAELNAKLSTIRTDAFLICRQHGVNGRKELLAKHHVAGMHQRLAV